MRKKELFSRNLIENKRRMPQRPLEVVSDFVIEKMPQLIKPLLAALIIAVALVPVLSLVMADVEQLGPLELTNGSYTSNTQPEFEFLLSYEEEGFPLSYRIEVADAPDNWSGDSNSRVIRYDLGGIEEEDLTTPFFFTVGQAEGEDGDYGDGGPDQTLADGSYWWRVRTTDNDGIESAWVTAGIETEGEEVPAFIVDTTPPVINNIELVGDDPTSETTVEVTGTATDATGTVENVQFKVDSNTNGGWTDCVADDETFDQAQENFSCTVTDLDDGESEIYLRASDNTGNQTDVEDRPFQTVLVVTQGPEFPSGLDSTPEPGVWFNEDEISISWEAAESAGADLAGYYWVFDTNSNTDPSDGDSFLNSAALGHTLEDVPNGDEHWFHIRAVDELDNLGETVHIGPFFIDTEDPTEPSTPETTVASPLNTNTPTWEWDASDDEFSDISHYVAEWSQDETFDDGITEIFTAPTADEVATFTHTTELDDGTWFFRVYAVDNAGNESSPSDPGSVLIDTQAPSDPGEPTVTEANEADIVSTGDITVTWTASSDDGGSGLANPAYTFEYSQDVDFDDSDIITTNTPSVELELTEGRWYFQVWATDLAGNTSGQTPGEVLVDLTPPSAPGAPSGPAAVVGDTQVLITWDPSTDDISEVDFYTIEYSQNSDFTGSTTADTADDTNSIELTLADGTWYMQVWATDLAGHESNESDPGEVTVDTQAPIISELQVAFEEDDPEEGTQQATVSWETDKPTTATIEYGFTTEYGTQDESLILDTEHSFDLPGLLACTTYLYEISVTDAVDNSATLDSLEFTTPGCVGSAEPISQISQEIAPGGGEIEFTGEEDSVLLTLDIPADFSEESDDVVFQIKQLDAQEVDDETATPTGLSWIGSYAYDLKALAGTDTNITEFDQPISITLYFEATDVSGIDLTTVQIFRWDTSGDDGEWLELDSCGEVTVDPENPDRYSITCETSNFSVFGLFGEEIPEPTPSPTPTPQPSSSSSGSSSGTSAPTVPFCSDTKPSGTPDLFQIDVTNTQATLYFSPATGSVNKYFVAYGYESEQELFGVEFDQGESGGVLSYTVSHLTPNTTYVFKLRAGNGCMPGDWSNEMRVQTGGSDVVTKFYKNFVQQIISSLPRAVSSLTPGTPTSPGSTMIGFDDGTLTETTPEQQESSFSDPSGSSESPSDDASENAEDNGGFWSWLRRRLRRLFGML